MNQSPVNSPSFTVDEIYFPGGFSPFDSLEKARQWTYKIIGMLSILN